MPLEEAVFRSGVKKGLENGFRHVAEIVNLVVAKADPQQVVMAVVANGVDGAGFDRVHLHDSLPRIKDLGKL